MGRGIGYVIESYTIGWTMLIIVVGMVRDSIDTRAVCIY